VVSRKIRGKLTTGKVRIVQVGCPEGESENDRIVLVRGKEKGELRYGDKTTGAVHLSRTIDAEGKVPAEVRKKS